MLWVLVAPLRMASADESAERYALVGRIQCCQDVHGWDYAAIDARTHRLYLAANGVLVLDLASRHTIVNFIPTASGKMIHSVIPISSAMGALADATDNRVALFDATTGRVLVEIPTGAAPDPHDWHNPDALLMEPSTGLLVAVNGDSGELILIDTTKRQLTGRIHIGGRLEFAAAGMDGGVYVNVASKNALALVNVRSRKLLKVIPLSGCEEPTGLAFDPSERLAVSVCSNGTAQLVASGGVIDTFKTPIAAFERARLRSLSPHAIYGRGDPKQPPPWIY